MNTQQHKCTPECKTPGNGLAKHNNEVLALVAASEAKDKDPVDLAGAATRKPWPALIKQWAARGVTVEGPDVYGCYSYTRKDGTALHSFNLHAPAKPSGVTALIPAFTATGEPSLFKGYKRSKVRELTTEECRQLDEDFGLDLDFEAGIPERLSGLRSVVRLGSAVYVFTPTECRQWRPEEIAEREAKYKKEDAQSDPRFAAIPRYTPEEHGLPVVRASVIVTDERARTATLYHETEMTKEESTDVYDIFS